MIGFAIVAFMAPTASAALTHVQDHYAKTPQLTVSVTKKDTNPIYGKTTTMTGTAKLQRPGKMRWELGSGGKVRKAFVSDGTDLFVIDHVNRRIDQGAASGNAGLPAAVAFLDGNATLTKDFSVALTTTSGYGGASATVLELVPKAPSAQVKKLYLVVDPATWDVTESVVIDASDNITDFVFASPHTAAIPASTFVIDPKKQFPGYAHTVHTTLAPAKPAAKPPITKPVAPAKK